MFTQEETIRTIAPAADILTEQEPENHPYTFLVASIKWHLCERAILGLQGALESSDSKEKMLPFGVGLNITYREL